MIKLVKGNNLIRAIALLSVVCVPLTVNYRTKMFDTIMADHYYTQSSCAYSNKAMPPLIKAADFKNSTNYFPDYTLRLEKYKNEKANPILYHAAVCSIRKMVSKKNPYLQHFPHLMQVLYQCIDYWLENSNFTPILLYDEEQLEYLNRAVQRSEFAKGVMLVLQSKSFAAPQKGGMKMMTNEEYVDSEYFHPNQTIQSYGLNEGFLHQRSAEWNSAVHQYFLREGHNLISGKINHSFSSNQVKNSNMQPPNDKCMILPRIRILNRIRSRRILNTEEILDELHDLYNELERKNTRIKPEINSLRYDMLSSVSKAPPVAFYFEGATFHEQVKFFFNTDILVSVHGAQLTGISMIGLNPCSQLLELFPPQYAIPYYFGPLAVQAGVSYSYIYFNESTMVLPGETEVSRIHEERVKARSSNLCPSKILMKNALNVLINDWEKCCHGGYHD